ncbi:MAG: nitroreductase [Alphaproteobacteria bacterium]|jgi:nitroreductase|nr:nitroreductase [Alphaproteobacteria bacterium]
MDTMQALMSRISVPPKLLGDPAPEGADLDELLAAAMRAPDHGALQPWRFLIVRGEARARLGEVFVDALKKRDPAADEEAIEKERNRPLHAPMIVVAYAKVDPSIEKVPVVEQIVSTGTAAYNIMLAAQAKGYGAIMLTGANAYDSTVKSALGLQASDAIVAFIHLGTPIKQVSDKRRPDAQDFVSEWTG